MNQQEIKELFQKWERLQDPPPLRSNHLSQFQWRLKNQKKTRQKYFVRWVATVLLCVGLGGVFHLMNEETSIDTIQFQKAEFHLMQLIEEQITAFEKANAPDTKKIFEQSKRQLDFIQDDYRKLHKKWEANPSQPQLIKALIGNLNTQISLLNDINSTLNKIKNNHYESNEI
ncbi:MAG: hypothetical protein HOH47_01635 [Flavobacteriaceae bacterium]|jgi:DNA repair exonuclease SbcCD ATPase subunit|nr:hypothetical protein [Flavobacteriaceae bacterium]